MADQFSTLRRELNNVQRSLAELQRRLPAPHQLDPAFEPLHSVEEDRRRSLRAPLMDSRHLSEADSDVAGRRCLTEGLSLPVTVERLSNGSAISRRSLVPASRQADTGPSKEVPVIRRQNATNEDDDHSAASTTNNQTSTTGEDATSAFSLCL